MNLSIVAVHGGAGYHEHTEASDIELKKVLKQACKETIGALCTGVIAIDAVSQGISLLEDNPSLNAGYGSNLTLEGTVECDASIMDARSQDFGSVGAVHGIKNPIMAAHAVLRHSRIPDGLGRIPPLCLVGEGAVSFARQNGVQCVSPNTLICPRARQEWEVWKTRLEATRGQDTHAEGQPWNKSDLYKIQDTVGAVVLDGSGNMAAGVSSGGLLLKFLGRIGEAAVYGAGCWALERLHKNVKQGVACSVSGSGEYIVRAMLARTIGDAVTAGPGADVHDILQHTLNEFHETCRSRGETEPSAGVLLLVQETEKDGTTTPRLWCAFTTQSMAVAYATSLDTRPRAMILRRPTPRGNEKGKAVFITTLSLTR